MERLEREVIWENRKGKRMNVQFLEDTGEVFYESTSIRKTIENLINNEKKHLHDIGHFLHKWYDNSSYIEVHTSGSTNAPNLVKLSKKSMIYSANLTGGFFNFSRKIKSLHCLPTQFIAGKMMLVRAIVLGWDIDIIRPTSRPLANIKTGYDFTAMTPMQVKQSLCRLHQIGTLIIGGAPLSDSLQREIREISVRAFETYGMTETATHIALRSLSDSTNNYFKCLPTIKVEKDVRDCLVINAPYISDRPIVTNDIIKLIDEYTFQWCGRYDYIINSGGIKIIPEVLEKKIEHFIPSPLFISKSKDKVLGDKVILLIEHSSMNKNELVVLFKEQLSEYERPRDIYFFDKFYYTSTGKIDRKRTLETLI